jgi:hypothetical protein
MEPARRLDLSSEKDRVVSIPDLSTRRTALKLAGAAALGAAGVAALGGVRVKAAGSGNTIDLFTPMRLLDTRLGHGPLTGGNDYDFGPFPAPGGFDSTSYYGLLANLTATGWNTNGWLSIRAKGSTLTTVSNVNFSGTSLNAIPNFVITVFGPPTGVTTTNGSVTIHCGGPASLHVDVVLDFFAYLGPDQ